jgi:DNA-binding NtrC family response regulator
MSRVLLVDEDRGARETFGRFLLIQGFDVLTAVTSREGLDLARTAEPDVIVLDDRYSEGLTGRDVLRILRQENSPAVVIMISGFGTAEAGFEAARLGAIDYLTKPLCAEELAKTIKVALALRCGTSEQAAEEPRDQASALLGKSYLIRNVRAQIRKICAAGGGGVLIEGETGSGKELVARAVHHESGHRAKASFVPVNCGALSRSLLESELFGHARGAFTGATEVKRGLFDAADGGTLFLDEISTLPLALQPALLRALESGEVRRLGETNVRRVDTRVIAASNSRLTDAVRAGMFREDLLYRLKTFHLVLPPLRARPEDILLLAEHFLAQHTRGTLQLGLDARKALVTHAWPGNVRELQHAIHRAATFANSGIIQLEDLPPEVLSLPEALRHHARHLPVPGQTELEGEKDRIVAALNHANGRIGKAAHDLAIGRTKMWNLMRKHGLGRPRSAALTSRS